MKPGMEGAGAELNGECHSVERLVGQFCDKWTASAREMRAMSESYHSTQDYLLAAKLDIKQRQIMDVVHDLQFLLLSNIGLSKPDKL